MGILHGAYIGQKRRKGVTFGPILFLIEIDAPMVFSLLEVILGSPNHAINLLRSLGDDVTTAPLS